MRARETPQHAALLAPNRDPLTYSQLAELADRNVECLNALGIGPGDTVAIVIPNGPEIASSFLCTGAGATAAPLNPGYRAPEFEFFLSDLGAKALLVQQGSDSVARNVAASLGVPVLELVAERNGPAGWYRLEGTPCGAAARRGFADPGDVALVLHTSGTTSRPKLVPLSHQNLLGSAGNVSGTLGLTAGDRCLNVMPLFHIHGLVAAVLASLYAGGSVVCTPGFLSPQFFDWLGEFQPTWYTAVPTMHQAVLARAKERGDVPPPCRLRFIRSSSAALPPQVMAELEARLGAPVIEAYGMTEAAHQMASNPLPPGRRKPGSVGRAAGPEIAVAGEKGAPLGAGQIGEIVICGANVTSGYAHNPEANAAAFAGGWFRTGDQGYLDEDGYLYLTGRIKELINRGGEKISPREIDEAMLDHPAVAQALCFAIPDERLGEEVGVAVVLRAGATATPGELRDFAADRLIHFKVPRRVVFVDELPKGPTGKPQRIGMAKRLGITSAHDPAPVSHPEFGEATTITEKKLAEIWCAALRVPRVGRRDDFFALGGDSILATQVVARVREIWHVEVPVTHLLEAQTLEAFAAIVERSSALIPVSAQTLERLINEIRGLPDAEVERQLREAEMTGPADPLSPAVGSVLSAGAAEDSPK
jgi:acyl-CoA synthetase (AMP-forming)/AMP-acid ligase II